MDLYKNWDIYSKQYNVDKFYDVDKKQFLKELTNFSYSFAKYFNTVEVINKLEKSVDNLQIVNLVHQNWKLITDWKDEEKNPGKTYIGIWENKPDYKIMDWKANPSQPKWPLYHFKVVYRWDGNGEPEIPGFDKNTGDIIFWTNNEYQNTRSFLLKYINAIVQENIRVQQGGNPDYDDPNLGSERIIFDFEIVDESLWKNSFKSI
ncbi:spiroplasma phage ORF1-like family protein, partial [Spiroplasma phoeniceum]|uniref:spiroplasma phage ORF1-like family protein n=1 Tax=Spiroplasma phoeniceum TaxID=47835 RepID=UPI003364EC36